MANVGVLISGRGTNLQALIDAAAGGRLGGRIAVVISNVEAAPGLDSGPIVLQEAVVVQSTDSPDALAARILEAEHRIYPRAVRAILEGRCRVEGRRAIVEGS